jgi:hypothetical protein
MRRMLFIAVLAILIDASCKKTITHSPIPNGTYKGTFQRQIAGGGQISNVTITFSGNTWDGKSESDQYPALCHGTYKQIGLDSINFEDECFWTADFDWSLILSGNYEIKLSSKRIEITRNYNGNYKDVYELTKQ